eukprot:1240561-Pleurochrysis_carterae.AAC.1
MWDDLHQLNERNLVRGSSSGGFAWAQAHGTPAGLDSQNLLLGCSTQSATARRRGVCPLVLSATATPLLQRTTKREAD